MTEFEQKGTSKGFNRAPESLDNLQLEMANIVEALTASKLAFDQVFEIVTTLSQILGLQPLNISQGIDFYEEVRRFEIGLITGALRASAGNQSRAARLLKLNMTTLNSMMKRYDIDPAKV